MCWSLVALLAAAPLLGAPGVKEKGPVLYFPTKAGTKLVIEGAAQTAAARPFEATETVSRVELKGGTYYVTVEADHAGTGKVVTSVTAVSGGGVVRVSI